MLSSAALLSSFPSRALQFAYFTPDFQSVYFAFGSVDAITSSTVLRLWRI